MSTFTTTLLLSAVLAVSAAGQSVLRDFSNNAGKTLKDRIVKYDFENKTVQLEKNGRVPLNTFSKADQAYILHWNQVEGFKSTMRFKIDVEKKNWGRMKHEQNVTPYFMDAIQIPGKQTPNHYVLMIEDYEEYNAVYLEAEGFQITLKNQNFFPIENLVVESKVFYEQENYIIGDSLFLSDESSYTDTVTTNKVKFLSETVPIIVPREEVTVDSEAAIIVDHQVSRNSLVSVTEEENEDGDGDDGSEEDEAAETVDGFGQWDDHARRRKGKIDGVWFRVGIEDPEGNMVWREIASPSSISKSYTWDATSGS